MPSKLTDSAAKWLALCWNACRHPPPHTPTHTSLVPLIFISAEWSASKAACFRWPRPSSLGSGEVWILPAPSPVPLTLPGNCCKCGRLQPTHSWDIHYFRNAGGWLKDKDKNLCSKCSWFFFPLQHLALSSFWPPDRYDQHGSENLNCVLKFKWACQRVTGLSWGSTLPFKMPCGLRPLVQTLWA